MTHKRLAFCAIVAVALGLTTAGPIMPPSHHQQQHHQRAGAHVAGRRTSADTEKWSHSASSFNTATCNPHDSVFQAGQTYFFKYTATVESTLGDRAPIFGGSSSSYEEGLPWNQQQQRRHGGEVAVEDGEDTMTSSASSTGAPLPKVASLLTCKAELTMLDSCKAQLVVPSCKILEQASAEQQQQGSAPLVALVVATQRPMPEQHEPLVREAFGGLQQQSEEQHSKSKQLSALVSKYPVKALIKHGQVVALKAHKHDATLVLNIKRAILDTLQFNKARVERSSNSDNDSATFAKKEKSVFGECPTKYTVAAGRDGAIKVEKNLSKCTKLSNAVTGKSKCFIWADKQGQQQMPISVVCVEKQVLIGSYNNTKMTPMQPVVLTTRSIAPDNEKTSSASSSAEQLNDESMVSTTLAYEAIDETDAAEQLAKVLTQEDNQRILGKIEQVLERLVQLTLEKEAVTPKTSELFLELLKKIKSVKNIEPLVNDVFAQCPAKMTTDVQCPLEQKIKRDFLLQALIQTPTKAAMHAVSALIQNDQIERAIYEPLLYTSAFIKFVKQQVNMPLGPKHTGAMLAPAVTANYDYLTRMVEMCQQRPTRYCLLSLSTIVHEVYDMKKKALDIDEDDSEDTNTNEPSVDLPEPVKRAVQFLLELVEPAQCHPSEALRRAHELTEIDTVLLALKAWGNAGDVLEEVEPDFAEKFIVPCIKRFTKFSRDSSASFEQQVPRSGAAALSRKQRRFETNEPAQEEDTEDDTEEPTTPYHTERSGQYPLNVSISAVFALRRTTPTESVKQLLFDLVLNERVPVEPRIAAVIQLTRFLTSADRAIIGHILQTVRSVADGARGDSSPAGGVGSTIHVFSFIASHWKNILRSSDPYYTPIAEVITEIEPSAYEILRQVERRVVQQRRGTFSRVYEMSVFTELPFSIPTPTAQKEMTPATVGFQYEQAWIFTPHSYLPTYVLTNVSLGTFGPYFNAIEIGVDMSDIERQLERTFGRQSAVLVPLKQAFGVVYNMFNRIVSVIEDACYKFGTGSAAGGGPQQLIGKIVRMWREYKQSGKLYGKKLSAHQLQTIFFSAVHAVQTGDKEPLVRELDRFILPFTSGSSRMQSMDTRQIVHKIQVAAKRLMAITERPMTKQDLIEALATVGVPEHATAQFADMVEQKFTNGQPIDVLLRAIQTFDVERIASFVSKVVDTSALKQLKRAFEPILSMYDGEYDGSEEMMGGRQSSPQQMILPLLKKASKILSRFNVGINVKIAGNEIVYFNVRELVHFALEKLPKFLVKQREQLQRAAQQQQGESVMQILPIMNIKLLDFSLPIPTASGIFVLAPGATKIVLSTAVKTSFVKSSEGSGKEFVIKVKPSFALTSYVSLLKIGLTGGFGARLSSKMSLSHKSDFGFYGKKPTASGSSSKKQYEFGIVFPEEPVTLLQFDQKLVHRIAGQEERDVARLMPNLSGAAPQTKRVCVPQSVQRMLKMKPCVELSTPCQWLLKSLSSIYGIRGGEEQGRYEQREEDTTADFEYSSIGTPSAASAKLWLKKLVKSYKALVVGPTKLRLVVTPSPQLRSKALVLSVKPVAGGAGGRGQEQEEDNEVSTRKHNAARRHQSEQGVEEETEYDGATAATEAVDFEPTSEYIVKIVLKDVARLVQQIESATPSTSGASRRGGNWEESSSSSSPSRRRQHQHDTKNTKPFAAETDHDENDDEDDEDNIPPYGAEEQEDDTTMTPFDRTETDTESDGPATAGKTIATGHIFISRPKKAIVVELKLKKLGASKKLIWFVKPTPEARGHAGSLKVKGFKVAVQVVDKEAGGERKAPCEIFTHIVLKKSPSSSSSSFEDNNIAYAPEDEQEDVEQVDEQRMKRVPRSRSPIDREEQQQEDNTFDSAHQPSPTELVKPEYNMTFTYGIQLPKKFVWVMQSSLLKKQQKLWVEHMAVYGANARLMPQSLRFVAEKSKELLIKLKEAGKRAGLAVGGGRYAADDEESIYATSPEGFKQLITKFAYGVDAKRQTQADQDIADVETTGAPVKTLRFFWLNKIYVQKRNGAYVAEPVFVVVHDVAVDVKSLKYVKLSTKAVWKNLLKADGSMSLAKIEWKMHTDKKPTVGGGAEDSDIDTGRQQKRRVDYQLTVETPLAIADVLGAMMKKPSTTGGSDDWTCQSSHRAGIVFAPLLGKSTSSGSFESADVEDDTEDDDELVTPAPTTGARHHARRSVHREVEPATEEEQGQDYAGGRVQKERVPLRKIIGDIDEELTKFRRAGKPLIVERLPRKFEAQQQLTKFNISIVTVSTASDRTANTIVGDAASHHHQQWFTSSPSRRQHHEINDQSPQGLTQFNTEVLISVKPAGEEERIVQAIHLTTNVEAKVAGKNIFKLASLNVSNRERRQFDDEAITGAVDTQGELIKVAFDTVGTLTVHRIPDMELARKQAQSPFKFVVPPTAGGNSGEQQDIVMSGLCKLHSQRGLLTRLHIDTALPSLKALSPMRRSGRQQPEGEDNTFATDKSKKIHIQQFMELCLKRQKFIVSLNVTSPLVHVKSYGQLVRPLQVGGEMFWHSESEPRETLLRSTSPRIAELVSQVLTHRADAYGKLEQNGEMQTTANIEHAYLTAQSTMRAQFVPANELVRTLLEKVEQYQQRSSSEVAGKTIKITRKLQQLIETSPVLRKMLLPTNIDMNSKVLINNAAQPEIRLKLTTHKLHLKSEISLKSARQEAGDQKLIVEIGKPNTSEDMGESVKFIAKIKHIPSEKALALKIALGPKQQQDFNDVEEERVNAPSGGPRTRRHQKSLPVEEQEEEEQSSIGKKVLTVVLEQTNLVPEQQQTSKLVKLELSLKKTPSTAAYEEEDDNETEDDDSEDTPTGIRHTIRRSTTNIRGGSDKKLVIKMLVKPAPLMRTAVAVQKATFGTALKVLDIALPDETIDAIAQDIDQLVKEPRNPLAKILLKTAKIVLGVKADQKSAMSLEEAVNVVLRKLQHTPLVKLIAHLLDVAPEQLTPLTAATHIKNFLASNPLETILLKHTQSQTPVPEPIEQIIRQSDRVLSVVVKAVDMTAGRYVRNYMRGEEEEEITTRGGSSRQQEGEELEIAQIVRKMLKQNKQQIKKVLLKLNAMSAKPENIFVNMIAAPACVAVDKVNQLELASAVKALIKITFASLEQVKRDTVRLVKIVAAGNKRASDNTEDDRMNTVEFDFRSVGDKLVKLIPSKIPTNMCSARMINSAPWNSPSGRRHASEEDDSEEMMGENDESAAGTTMDSRQAMEKFAKLLDWVSTVVPFDIEVENVPQQEALKVKAEMPIADKKLKKLAHKIEKLLTLVQKKLEQAPAMWSSSSSSSSLVGDEDVDDEVDVQGGKFSSRKFSANASSRRQQVDSNTEEEQQQDNEEGEHQLSRQQLKKRAFAA